jgi:pyridoxine 5-phosphate synthase
MLGLRPDQVTLVAEREGEITTEGGLNVIKGRKPIENAVRQLQKENIEISLFIDPALDQIEAAADVGVTMIELNTRAYSETCPRSPDLADPSLQRELHEVVEASERGAAKHLKILAGHGLTYRNVRLISDISDIIELNIGHNIIARAVLVGMERAVRDMLNAMGRRQFGS